LIIRAIVINRDNARL